PDSNRSVAIPRTPPCSRFAVHWEDIYRVLPWSVKYILAQFWLGDNFQQREVLNGSSRSMTTKNVRRFSWKVRSRGTKPTARETVGLFQVPRYLPVCQRDESKGLDSAARLRLVPAISVPQQQTRRELR